MSATHLTPAPALAPRPLRLEWVTPDSVAENPRNWRRHPELQKEALAASLDECGWAGALLYNELTARLIDGHARRDQALKKGIPAVPVLVGSWSVAQEAKILATLDPLGSLAETDSAALDALLADVETNNQALATLLDRLAEEAKLVPELTGGAGPGEDGGGAGAGPEEGESSGTADAGGPYMLRVTCPTDARRADLMSSLRADGYDVAIM
jgi:hypothetical protein